MRFRSSVRLIGLSILLTVATQSFATGGVYLTVKSCQSFLMARLAPIRDNRINLSEEALSELQFAHSALLSQKLSTKTFINGNPIPERLYFKEKEFRVDAYIDSGGEGDVFLVSNQEGKFVIKKFRWRPGMEKNLRTAEVLRIRGFNILSAIEVDKQNLMVRYPYVNGLDMYQILGSDVNRNPMRISEKTRNSVQSAFKDFINEVSSAYSSVNAVPLKFLKTNVMLDLDAHKFVIVDPL